jgi:hypothetical protein
MDLPLLVTPGSLTQLHVDLAAASLRVGRIAGQVVEVADMTGWRGGAEHAFATAARTAGAQCDLLARRLRADAVRVDRLAEDLIDELRVLQHLEDEIVDAVEDLARKAFEDPSGDAAAVYERVRRMLPDHLSPLWHGFASTIGHLL